MATRDFEYVAAAFLARITIGVLFLVAGIGKFVMGYKVFIDYLTGAFANSWIPQILVSPFAYVLPVVEIALGLLVILGLWSRITLLVSGLIFVLFAGANMAIGDGPTVGLNVLYLLVTTFALYLHGYDDWRFGS